MSSIKKLYRRAERVPADLAFGLLQVPPFKQALDRRSREAIDRHRPLIPDLSDDDRLIAEDLTERGTHVTSLDRMCLPGTDAMLMRARDLHRRFDEQARGGPQAFTNPEAVQASRTEIMQRPEIFYWGLNDRLIRIVEHYLGVPVAYDGLNFFYTLAGSRERGARRWHRDQEDDRMVKIALYLHGVEDDGGPLQILPNIKTKIRPWMRPVLTNNDHIVSNDSYSDNCSIKSFPGPAGTLIFCDTARHFHRGKPDNKVNRCVIYFKYFSRRPRYPFFCERSTITRTDIRELATTVSQAQRECVLWHDHINPVLALIPLAPLSN